MQFELLVAEGVFTLVQLVFQLAFNLLGRCLNSKRERDPESIAMTSAGGDESSKGCSGLLKNHVPPGTVLIQSERHLSYE